MAQFDVYENINEKTKVQTPFLLDIQNDILKIYLRELLFLW